MKLNLGGSLDEFDKILLEVIDETLRYSLGEKTVEIFYDYLRRKGFPLRSIPQNTEFFFNELRSVLEFDGQRFHTVSPLGIVSLLERTIVEILCKKFGVKFEEKGPILFSEWVDKLREVYLLKFSKLKVFERRR
ncbi:MAG: hypothetical protein QXJ07_05390 [Candidatus Bathyarchaeia archaeon]